MRRPRCSLTCVLSVLLGAVSLAPGWFVAGAEAEAPTFTAQTAGGAAGTGPLVELGDGWRARLGGAKPLRTDTDDLLELRQDGRLLPPLPDGEQLLFANGDRVPGTVVGLAGEHLRFRPRLAEGREADEARVPLSALAVVWLAAPDDTDLSDRRRRELADGKRARDVVVLRNGDAVEGILAGLNDRVLQVEADKKTVEVRRDQVAAVALNTELAATLRPKGAYGRLTLANGARLSVASASCADGKTLTAATLFGSAVRLPLAEVVALHVHQGKAVYLSDLKPARYESTPFAPTPLPGPFAADGNAAGRDLHLKGEGTFQKGVGLRGGGRLTYALAGGYRRFEALVGLDEFAGRGGSARVSVLVDGKPADLGRDRDLTARDGALRVRVDVRGARELTLAVEHGRGGPVDDVVNWADARLVR